MRKSKRPGPGGGREGSGRRRFRKEEPHADLIVKRITAKAAREKIRAVLGDQATDYFFDTFLGIGTYANLQHAYFGNATEFLSEFYDISSTKPGTRLGTKSGTRPGTGSSARSPPASGSASTESVEQIAKWIKHWYFAIISKEGKTIARLIDRAKTVAGGRPVVIEMVIADPAAPRPPSLADFMRQVEGDVLAAGLV